MTPLAAHLARRTHSPARPPRTRLLTTLAAAALLLLGALAWAALREASRPAPPPARPVEATDREALARLEARLAANPDDVPAYAELGLGLLQQARVTGDPSLYTRAGQAFDAALARDPAYPDALFGRGVLALALHRFQDALKWGEQARAANPFRAAYAGVTVDALVELGRYPQAVAAAQAMVNLRPDANAYGRIAYLRELHGDAAGARAALESAQAMSLPGTEPWAWYGTQLGHLAFSRGDLDRAHAAYTEVLALRPATPAARFGAARVALSRGDTARAERDLADLAEQFPLPETLILLGDLYTLRGDAAQAAAAYDTVRVVQQLNAAAGMDVDMELALFEADHGDPARAVEMARAAYARRPTIYAADALAWALHRAGDDATAARFSRAALRLGTADALLYYHAGMIAAAQSDSHAARIYLDRALKINPYFSPLHAPAARAALQERAGPR
jgi:tetratricopeptide (TPR) repeat protein